MIELNINNRKYMVDVDQDTPLLWVLRDHIGLTGTKYSCGNGYCGACTVIIDKQAIRSCLTPVSTITSSKITTIEGLAVDDKLHPVQEAWISEQVSQCGYCQPGQIMSAVALLEITPNPTNEDIDIAMNGNLCRCGTYQRIRKAIHKATELANR